MDSLAYRNDISKTRRQSESRQIALGCWIIPFEPQRPDVPDFGSVVPAVTYDLRRGGMGLLLRETISFSVFAVALPDKDGVWRFFECRACHQSPLPGGWNLAGLQILRIVELHPKDVTLFRECIHDTPEKAAPMLHQSQWS
jgi:hypothetical protein